MSDSVQHYAAACALSNMGVALMDGGCLSQARSTFQAASAAMGMALPGQKTTSSQRQHLLNRTKAFLQESLNHLANPMPVAQSSSSSSDSMDFEREPIDELRPVRVSGKTGEYNPLVEPCTESACILYNYALSTWRLSQYCAKNTALDLKKKALELWHMSSSVLQRNGGMKNRTSSLDEQRQETVLHLAIMEGLYTAATDLGHEIPVAWLDRQTNLLMTLDALDELTAYSEAHVVSASAA